MKNFALIAAVTGASLMVAACDEGPSNATANSSEPILTITDSGNESGNVSLNLPGLSAKIRMPTEMMTGGKFDIDGVSLFPGSKMTNMKIGSADEDFSMTFDAPAEPGKISSWFQERFAEKSIAVTKTTNGLTGETTDGNRFTITLAPAAAGHSAGTISIANGKN
jgi:hypothetical protein